MPTCEGQDKMSDGKFVECDSRYADECLVEGKLCAVESRLCGEHQQKMKDQGYRLRKIKRYKKGEHD